LYVILVVQSSKLVSQGRTFNEQSILKELSPCLREEVLMYNCADLINSVPIFENVSEEFVFAIASKMFFTVFIKDEVTLRSIERLSSIY